MSKDIDFKQYHIFKNNKVIASSSTMKKLKDEVKKTFDAPSKNIKVYIISFSSKINFPLTITCSQFTITPKLTLIAKDDDMSQKVYYNKEEYEKYKFKMSHIKKIIKALKDELLSIEPDYWTISEVLSLKKKK